MILSRTPLWFSNRGTGATAQEQPGQMRTLQTEQNQLGRRERQISVQAVYSRAGTRGWTIVRLPIVCDINNRRDSSVSRWDRFRVLLCFESGYCTFNLRRWRMAYRVMANSTYQGKAKAGNPWGHTSGNTYFVVVDKIWWISDNNERGDYHFRWRGSNLSAYWRQLTKQCKQVIIDASDYRWKRFYWIEYSLKTFWSNQNRLKTEHELFSSSSQRKIWRVVRWMYERSTQSRSVLIAIAMAKLQTTRGESVRIALVIDRMSRKYILFCHCASSSLNTLLAKSTFGHSNIGMFVEVSTWITITPSLTINHLVHWKGLSSIFNAADIY